MQPKSQGQSQAPVPVPEFAEPVVRKPLILLRDTERSLRVKTVETIAPLLPEQIAENLGEASIVADKSLEQLAKIDLDTITPAELKPARMQMGMLFVGFGALAITFLLMFQSLLPSQMDIAEQVRRSWHQYVWFVGLGITGLFMMGREAMRPVELPDELENRSDRG
ncbi:MAG: hypothetical protein NW224_21470 [Leptolyngbyaceae cyanobacterium bins.302]|nr:hypothetical protein [Leptolyngbyaceae cyanobacterium bins.302]